MEKVTIEAYKCVKCLNVYITPIEAEKCHKSHIKAFRTRFISILRFHEFNPRSGNPKNIKLFYKKIPGLKIRTLTLSIHKPLKYTLEITLIL